MLSLCNQQKYFDQHKNLKICQTNNIIQLNAHI